jgi:subtilisin family serine protease
VTTLPQRTRSAGIALLVALIAVAGWWIGKRSFVFVEPHRKSAAPHVTPAPVGTPPSPSKTALRAKIDFDLDAIALDAIAGERVVTFDSDEAMRRFLAALEGSGIRLLGSLPRLRAVRVGFDDLAALLALLDDEAQPGMIYPVYVPTPPSPDAQAGAVGIGARLLEILGIRGDHSLWGKGVTVAVLDTGVASHPAFADTLRKLSLVPDPSNPADLNGHGTAVASLIAGSRYPTEGVAPAANLLSIRVANDEGLSNSFLLAEGILAAIDGGASVINISLGSYGDSPVLANAVELARSLGIAIVASAGNDGLNRIAYPAAYQGVIGVGASDAVGQHLAFSNGGSSLSATAPGYEVAAAWPGDMFVSFTGTSASAPVVAGAIAATMASGSGPRLTASQAATVVLNQLNEAGYPGTDPLYGQGLVDMGRVARRDQPGVVDAAIASQVIEPATAARPYPLLLVTVENRGTTLLVNSAVQVTTPAGSMPLNVTTLPPGQTQTFRVPISGLPLAPGEPIRVSSSIDAGAGLTDFLPANNQRVDQIVPPAADAK